MVDCLDEHVCILLHVLVGKIDGVMKNLKSEFEMGGAYPPMFYNETLRMAVHLPHFYTRGKR